MAKIFTLAEVSEHNTRNDCWLTIFGKVLDVTSFLDEHPGGDELLLNATGKDATDEFTGAGHTYTAWEMLDEYRIGEIDKSTLIPKEATPPSLTLHKQAKIKSKYTYLLQFFIPLILFNLLVAFFSKSSA